VRLLVDRKDAWLTHTALAWLVSSAARALAAAIPSNPSAPTPRSSFFHSAASSGSIRALDDNLDTYFDMAAVAGAKLCSASVGNRCTHCEAEPW